MIRFVCTCGHAFEFADDKVGENFQCPQCFRLVEVPRIEDLASFNPDGTVKLEAPPVHASDLASKFRAFGGHDDMRTRAEPTIPLAPQDAPDAPPAYLAPRYDPETGELVEALAVRPSIAPTRPDGPMPVLPIETPKLAYPSRAVSTKPEKAPRTLRWWQLPWRLLQGVNLMAIVFVFLAHVVLHGFLIVPAANLLLLPVAVLLALAIVAHYANVMEEFGPRERDTIPPLMRSVSLSEDVIQPLYSLLWAAIFAFAPVLFALIIGLRHEMLRYPLLLAALGAWGAVVFPAAAFTMSTSGAMQNLLPAHVFSVIIAAPGRYLLACLAFIVGATAYAIALNRLVFTSISLLLSSSGTTIWSDLLRSTAVMYAMIVVAIYALHLSAAWMGMLYRSHYERFNWVWQRHERENRPAPLVAPKREPSHVVDHARLAEIRQMEADRRARHAESMRK